MHPVRPATQTIVLFLGWIFCWIATGSFGYSDEIRTWTDSTGSFRIEAEFVELKGNIVTLKEKNGRKRAIPLNRLTEADQTLAKDLAKNSAEDNPFEMVDETVDEKADGVKGKPELILPNWDDVIISNIAAGDRWEVTPGTLEELDYTPRIVGLPDKRDFFEGGTAFVVNAKARRGLYSYALGDRPGPRNSDKVTSRIVLVDLATGKTLANVVGDGKWVAKAIHNDGERFILEGQSGEEAGSLATCTASGKRMTVLDLWVPYSNITGDGRRPWLCQFADEKRLVTSNESGTIVVWDFDKKEVLSSFKASRTCTPTLSPDGRYIAFCGGGKMGVFDIEAQDAIGMKQAADMIFHVRTRVSPSGKYIAAASQQKLMIWEAATGEVRFEGTVPGLNLAFGLQFPHDDFVLIDKEYLVEWQSRIKVWQYNAGGGDPPCMNGYTFFSNGVLVPVKLPHPEAGRILEEAKKQSDLFVIKKGASVRLDVSEVPEQYREEVLASLTKQVQASGCVLADAAPVTIKASISGPKKSTVSYFRLGSFDFKTYSSGLQYLYDEQSIWNAGASNEPGMLMEKRDKSYQQMIDEAASKPNLDFYATVRLPEFLQKPLGKPTNNRSARPQQTIGVSKITSNGLE